MPNASDNHIVDVYGDLPKVIANDPTSPLLVRFARLLLTCGRLDLGERIVVHLHLVHRHVRHCLLLAQTPRALRHLLAQLPLLLLYKRLLQQKQVFQVGQDLTLKIA